MHIISVISCNIDGAWWCQLIIWPFGAQDRAWHLGHGLSMPPHASAGCFAACFESGWIVRYSTWIHVTFRDCKKLRVSISQGSHCSCGWFSSNPGLCLWTPWGFVRSWKVKISFVQLSEHLGIKKKTTLTEGKSIRWCKREQVLHSWRLRLTSEALTAPPVQPGQRADERPSTRWPGWGEGGEKMGATEQVAWVTISDNKHI